MRNAGPGLGPQALGRFFTWWREDKKLHKLVHSDRAGADWRTQFKRHPMRLIGIALGAGMALSAAYGGKRHISQREMLRRLEATPVRAWQL